MSGEAYLLKGELRAGGEEGAKKSPAFALKDRGFLPASTLHSLYLEDSFVKRIRTRFSDSRIILLGLTSSEYFWPPCAFPILTTSGFLQVSSPNTAAGPSPSLTGFPFSGYSLFD